MAVISDLPKSELLVVLESVPQHFWPPRPTRQDKAALVGVISRAMYRSQGGSEVRQALAGAWARAKLEKLMAASEEQPCRGVRGMKVWVSKYALLDGLKEVEVDPAKSTRNYVYPKGGGLGLELGRDCHETRQEAEAQAEKMRVAKIASLREQTTKIASLRKQIAKLEKLSFAADAGEQ